MQVKRILCAVLLAVAASTVAHAGDIRIPLPKKSKTTPVQELNRQGVQALRKNQLEKAKGFFYKAYLYDPDDPRGIDQALQALAEPDFRRRMGTAARARVVRDFSWDAHCRALDARLQSLVAS